MPTPEPTYFIWAMRPLRILQVSDAYYPFPGGVTEHMHHLSVYLRKRGHRVIILTADYGQEGGNFPDVVRIGKVRILPPLKLFNMTQLTVTVEPFLHLKVRDFMRTNEFDIVHTHGPLAPNLPHLALHYSRSVNVATFHTAFVGFNWHKIGRIFFKKDAKKIHCFVGVSRVALDAIGRYYEGRKVIIPNGIDTERFRPDHPPLEHVVKLDGIKILYVGRLEPRKGFPFLLKAFKILKEKIRDLHLVVVGSGVEEKKYKKMVPEELRKFVHFEGFVPPELLPRYYVSCDIYTSPAVGGETFGIVLLEAMASGIPVVASSIPGYREVLEDGVEGFLIDARNPQRYASVLERLIRDPGLRRMMGIHGREKALLYSWDSVAERMEELYLDLLEHAGRKVSLR